MFNAQHDGAKRGCDRADAMASVLEGSYGLQLEKIAQRLELLHRRIEERFPESGLRQVALELALEARTAEKRSNRLQRLLRAIRVFNIFVLLAVGVGVFAFVALGIVDWSEGSDGKLSIQGLDAAANLTILIGAGLIFLFSQEDRMRAAAIMTEIDRFRNFAHIVDLHQQTKDPTTAFGEGARTMSSPARTMSAYEVTRYFDYCAEMLALIGKISAVYRQGVKDPTVRQAVTEIEELTGALSAMIWQKIQIMNEQRSE